MEAIAVTFLTKWMARPTKGFTGQSCKLSLCSWTNPFIEITFRALFTLMQTLNNFQVKVDNGLVAAVAAAWPDIILSSLAAANTVAMTILTFSIFVAVFARRTSIDTKRAIFDILTLDTVIGAFVGAGQLALRVTLPAFVVTRLLEVPQVVIAPPHAFIAHLVILTGQTLRVARSPAAVRRTLVVTLVLLDDALFRRFVVLQQSVVLLGFHNPLPVNLFRVA